MKKLPLTQGKFALIDNRDYWLVRQFIWHAHYDGYNWYARTNIGRGIQRTAISMHRLLAGFPPFRLDHKNSNGLDNRRRNLRPASHSQNLANRGKQRNNTSGFQGAFWHKSTGKWQASIKFRGKQYYLGLFADLKDAAAAHKQAAQQLFGEFVNI